MTTSHADTHDLDKLSRWYTSLSTAQTVGFPVHAMFLVSADDRNAHNIFRQFRSSFGALSAEFQHLVIFGQHGLSSTVRGLVAELGIRAEPLPVLVLFQAPSSTTIYALPLAPGSDSTSDQRCVEVLGAVEAAAHRGTCALDMTSLPRLTTYRLGDGPVVQRVGKVLQGLS